MVVRIVSVVADVEITAGLIAGPLREQCPELADLPVRFGANGWDNQLWRLGDDLAIRLPWATQDAGDLLLKEYALVPPIAPRLPLPVPVPQYLGRPSERFPRPWMVTTWVAGEPADRAPATRGVESADILAAFLSALHRPAPDDAPVGRNRRGGPLAETSVGFEYFFSDAINRGLVSDPDAVRSVWDDALAAPGWEGPPIWLHGDLHAANLVTRDGTFRGVIDFGDMCAGDPACDLAAGWMLVPDGFIDRFYESYSPAVDAATMRRARGWAVAKAIACLIIGDNGVHGRPGGKATWGPPATAALERLTATGR